MRLLTASILLLVTLLYTDGYARKGGKESVEIRKTTALYAVKESDSLYMDRYEMPSEAKNRACVIFIFGGGFTHGTRDKNSYSAYFQRLVSEGYVVVSIDYRLGIKKVMEDPKKMETIIGSGSIDPFQALNAFKYTINIAVEDMYDATSYIIDHAQEWGVDEKMIVASGSSAGAVVALQGEYGICSKSEMAERVLPAGFNYAGVIAFAGAIFSMDGDLKWEITPAPIQMFHGDADANVPYDKVELFNIGMYGSKHIAEQLAQMQSPYTFYDIYNAAHEVASTPMQGYLDEIVAFLDESVVNKKHVAKHIEVRDSSKPDRNKNFELIDYIKNNYAPR